MAQALTRALFVAACLAAGQRAASAGPKARTTKVTIETDPPGAKVYFNAEEDGEVCTTPCTVDAPIGDTTIILEAENHRSRIDNLSVPRKSARPLRFQYKLELALGAVVVEGAPPGATVKIDDEDRGKAGRIEGVPAGAHRVVVEHNGATIYDQFVEIAAGEDFTVSPPAAAPAPPPPEQPVAAVVEPPPPRTRSAIAVTAAFDVGFRQFTYSDNRTPATQRDDSEAGQLLAGPIIEVWPAVLAGMDDLQGLAIYGRFEIGLNGQPVTIEDPQSHLSQSTSLKTTWRSIEVSVHHRWAIGDAGSFEVGAGYTDDSYGFTGDQQQIAVVPDASYSAVRLGGRASLRFGMIEPYLAAENRIVLSGGDLAGRYRLGASANGVHAALGASAHLGRVELRVEGALTRYSWTFHADVGDPMQASGGVDFIQMMTIALGYHY